MDKKEIIPVVTPQPVVTPEPKEDLTFFEKVDTNGAILKDTKVVFSSRHSHLMKKLMKQLQSFKSVRWE